MEAWPVKKTWIGVGCCIVSMLVWLALLSILTVTGVIGTDSFPIWIVHGVSAFLGCAVALKQSPSSRLLYGTVIGVLYIVALFLLSVAVEGDLVWDRNMVVTILAVFIGGLLAASMQPKSKKKKKGRRTLQTPGKRVVT